MARKNIGSVLKTKDEYLRYKDEKGNLIKEFYISINEDVNLKKGDKIYLENKTYKLASLEANREKMSAEVYEKALERIQNMKEFVAFDLVRVTKD